MHACLQEPFWPEGLGINRGFLHVLDCADLAKQVHVPSHVHGHGHTHAHTHMHMHMHIQDVDCADLAKQVHVPSHGHVHTHVHMHVHIRTHAHVHIHDVDCADLATQCAALEGQRREHAARASSRGDDGFDYGACLRQIVSRREALYNCTKRVSSTTIKLELKAHIDAKGELPHQPPNPSPQP